MYMFDAVTPRSIIIAYAYTSFFLDLDFPVLKLISIFT